MASANNIVIPITLDIDGNKLEVKMRLRPLFHSIERNTIVFDGFEPLDSHSGRLWRAIQDRNVAMLLRVMADIVEGDNADGDNLHT